MSALKVAHESIAGLGETISVHLGDGITRVKAGERLEHADVTYTGDWAEISSVCGGIPALRIERRPGKHWILSDKDFSSSVPERRKLKLHNWVSQRISEDDVLVIQEGLALPTRELLFAVNTAHAVLVLRGTKDCFYLSDDFVLSAPEERALVEWGVGRPLLANSLLAVGGMLLFAVVEDFWQPAVVGTLLVAAAGYRVQGAMTKVSRIESKEWKSGHKLVPSGILGTERVVQGVLVTLVALADLLDDRWLLLAALALASAQVVVLEYVGQARLTWGYARVTRILFVQLGVWISSGVLLVAKLWLTYIFAGFYGIAGASMIALFALQARVEYCFADSLRELSSNLRRVHWLEKLFRVLVLAVPTGGIGVGIWAAVLGWDDADLKHSWQSAHPWRWPLLRAPDSFSTGARMIGLWFGVLGGLALSAYIVVGMFSCRISSDGFDVVGLGERKLAREVEDSPGFSHYDEKPIPSRHLLMPNVEQQPQRAPVESVV